MLLDAGSLVLLMLVAILSTARRWSPRCEGIPSPQRPLWKRQTEIVERKKRKYFSRVATKAKNKVATTEMELRLNTYA